MSKKSGTQLKLPKVPIDHIIINERWRGSKLSTELCGKYGGLLSNELRVVDFCPADDIAVLYFSEEDYASCEIKKRLKPFFEIAKNKGVVIAERNTQTLANYAAVQDYAAFSLNLFVFPVAGPQEVPDILKDLGYIKNRSPDNPFHVTYESKDLASTQLSLLTVIPNVGRKKAQELLGKFGHIKAINQASEEQLATCVGPATAKFVYQFFHNKFTSPS